MKPRKPSIKKPPKPKVQTAPMGAKKKVSVKKGNPFSTKLEPVVSPMKKKKKKFGVV